VRFHFSKANKERSVRNKRAYLRDYKINGLPEDLTPTLAVEKQWVKPEPPKKIYQINKDDDRPPHRGRVVDWDPTKRFGFICSGHDLGYQRIFFHEGSIIRDPLGHKCDATVGTEVEFLINERPNKQRFASNVRPTNRPEVDLTVHSEFSKVCFWDGFHHGYLDRGCGNSCCSLPFFVKDIVTQGVEEIRLGDFVQHGVMPRGREGSGLSRACNVVLYESGFLPPVPEPVYEPGSIEEQFLLNASEEAEPQPTPAPEPSAFSPEEMKLSLREIIRRRKAA
jgi:hypothetical protein